MNMPQHTFKTDQDTIDLRPYMRGLYIDGQWRQAADGRLIEVVDPSTERVIAEVPDAAMVDVEAAVEAAARAAAGWSQTPPRKRSEILRRCFELMTQRSETLAALISIENGKALRDARGEVAYAAEFFRWNAEEAVRLARSRGLPVLHPDGLTPMPREGRWGPSLLAARHAGNGGDGITLVAAGVHEERHTRIEADDIAQRK